MIATRALIGLFHCLLMAGLAVPLVYVTYRVFVRANADFDIEAEMKKNNVAAGLLAAVILFCAAQFLLVGADSALRMLQMDVFAPAGEGPGWAALAGLIAAHLAASLLLALITISLTLRLFLRFMRRLEMGNELRRGNLAASLFLSSVIVVSTLMVREGAVSLSRALRPRRSIGHVQIQR
ncbi:MAG: hypothetical protein HY552_06705 [Elusimicrobia bacterium]|nr:hypothetical protein [Elusimicrobiota bacterium]